MWKYGAENFHTIFFFPHVITNPTRAGVNYSQRAPCFSWRKQQLMNAKKFVGKVHFMIRFDPEVTSHERAPISSLRPPDLMLMLAVVANPSPYQHRLASKHRGHHCVVFDSTVQVFISYISKTENLKSRSVQILFLPHKCSSAVCIW